MAEAQQGIRRSWRRKSTARTGAVNPDVVVFSLSDSEPWSCSAVGCGGIS